MKCLLLAIWTVGVTLGLPRGDHLIYPRVRSADFTASRVADPPQYNHGFKDWDFSTNEKGSAGSNPNMTFSNLPTPPSQYAPQQTEPPRHQVISSGSQYRPQEPTATTLNRYRPQARPSYESEPAATQYRPQEITTPSQFRPQKTQPPMVAAGYEPHEPSSLLPEKLTPPQGQLEQELSRGLLKLTLDLENNLNSNGNQVFSPTSIGAAMSLLLLGANGRTGQEIADLLGIKNAIDTNGTLAVHRKLGEMYGKIVSGPGHSPSELLFANGIFVQQGVKLKRAFLGIARSNYNSDVVKVNFLNEPQVAQNVINKWVSDRTRGRIPNLLSEPLDSSTKVVIGNALYFNGQWLHPFLEKQTKPRPFYVSENEVVEVPMMVNAEEVYYYGDKERGAKVLGLPYKDTDSVMYMVLPDKDLKTFVSHLTPADLQEFISAGRVTSVIYVVPKMKIEGQISLRSTLERLGVRSAFNDQTADLSSLAEKRGLSVSDVVHKVSIELSESGTVAAAATSVTLVKDGSTPLFRADKPFFFFIYHAPSATITFWGTVLKPTPNSPLSPQNQA